MIKCSNKGRETPAFSSIGEALMKKILIMLFLLFAAVSFSNYYYGNIHSHTSYSDGTSVPAIAYAHAKDSGKIDILSITDHARDLVFQTYK